jgi:hypothetical protein
LRSADEQRDGKTAIRDRKTREERFAADGATVMRGQELQGIAERIISRRACVCPRPAVSIGTAQWVLNRQSISPQPRASDDTIIYEGISKYYGATAFLPDNTAKQRTARRRDGGFAADG